MDVLIKAIPMHLAVESASYLSAVTILGGVGFIAAVTIGSVAWYNSKRPAGWENKERPDVVPKIEK
jgi:Na+/H+ antiporter NhaA